MIRFRKITSDNEIYVEDPDVAKERDRIENILNNGSEYRENETDLLIVQDLTKYYKNFAAVKELTFGVQHHECFGLLGVNGAGKTTTFSMLTGDLLPTDGDAFINGYISLTNNLKQFQKNIGYCPQFDALLDNLTGEELLNLMGTLRGIPYKVLNKNVQQLIKMVGLDNHAKKTTKTYSGGTRRKLSIAMALIGCPKMLFLDEPTSAVDPTSRRKIWKTLEFIKANYDTSIILTSHSMDECEALCSRIAIMVNGTFRCIGSTQHLRSKFGKGYTVTIRLKRKYETDFEYSKQILEKFCEEFPNSVLNDQHQCLMVFHLPDKTITWSGIFEKLIMLDEQFGFEDYVISDTTLESIFILFARSQKPEQLKPN